MYLIKYIHTIFLAIKIDRCYNLPVIKKRQKKDYLVGSLFIKSNEQFLECVTSTSKRLRYQAIPRQDFTAKPIYILTSQTVKCQATRTSSPGMKRYQGFFIPLRSRQKPFKDEKTGQGNQSTPNAKKLL